MRRLELYELNELRDGEILRFEGPYDTYLIVCGKVRINWPNTNASPYMYADVKVCCKPSLGFMRSDLGNVTFTLNKWKIYRPSDNDIRELRKFGIIAERSF